MNKVILKVFQKPPLLTPQSDLLLRKGSLVFYCRSLQTVKTDIELLETKPYRSSFLFIFRNDSVDEFQPRKVYRLLRYQTGDTLLHTTLLSLHTLEFHLTVILPYLCDSFTRFLGKVIFVSDNGVMWSYVCRYGETQSSSPS